MADGENSRAFIVPVDSELLKRLIEEGKESFDSRAVANELEIHKKPTPTSIGVPQEKSEFYEMDIEKLTNYYFSYENTKEFDCGLLYSDLVSIKIDDWHQIDFPHINGKDIRIEIEAHQFEIMHVFKKHANEALDIFKKNKWIKLKDGEFENNRTLSLKKIEGRSTFCCRKSWYFDQVGTNLVIDWESGLLPRNQSTYRNGRELPVKGRLPQLEDSLLANTFGITVMFFDRDLAGLVRIRNPDMASIQKSALHCTVSGVFELKEEPEPGIYSLDLFMKGAHAEIKTETGLSQDQYKLMPVAFARELPRGGKPQLFFVAITWVDENTLHNCLKNAEEKSEFHPFEDGRLAVSSENYDSIEKFTYEGWASTYLGAKFVEAN